MKTVARDMSVSGIQRAAILVASLDEATADLLLAQLDTECAEMVRRASLEIGEISAAQRKRIIEDFRRIQRLVPSECSGGIDLDGPLELAALSPQSGQGAQTAHSRVVDQSASDRPLQGATADRNTEESVPFGFLCEAEEEKLAQLLGSERPQAIALVLSHLPPPQAGEVLSRLAPPLQAEVVRRLVELENADPETLREVEQAVEARLSRLFANEQSRPARRDTIVDILASCGACRAEAILDNLAIYDEALAERLGRRPFEFEDLAELDDAALLAAFRAADPEIAQAALLGAAPQLVERILRRMMPREAKILRRKLNRPEPIRLSDLENARRQLAEIGRRTLRGEPRAAAA